MDGILARWGLESGRVRPDMPVQGSPERCLDRTVIETNEAWYLLEELDPASVARKSVIAQRLTHLAEKGLAVPAPLFARDGNQVQIHANTAWQLTPRQASRQ